MTMRWPHDEVLHAWWVQPGLLAGEYPGASTPEDAATKLDLLLEAGVDTIIDLTTDDDGLRPYDDDLHTAQRYCDPRFGSMGRRGVWRFSFPIPDRGVIEAAGYDPIMNLIRAEIAARRTVYVHCWGGRGRTSTVIGCLLADGGFGYDQVIDLIAELRAGTRKAHIPCPETEAQRDIIRARCDDPTAYYGLAPELR